MRQLLLDILPENPPSLENYIPGDNREAWTAFRTWLAAPSENNHVFLLWGDPGSGKSHLLHASGFFYLDARKDPACALLPETPERLAVDHLELLDKDGQIALFHAFNCVLAKGGKLLFAASAPAARLLLREDLRTRLGSGLTYRLRALSDNEKKAALAEIASARSMPLTEEALDYLLNHASRDMRVLAATLIAIDRYSLEQKRALTLHFLRAALNSHLRESSLEET